MRPRPELDAVTADRLAGGTIAATDAPRACAAVAELLQEVRTEVTPSELVRERFTVAAMTTAVIERARGAVPMRRAGKPSFRFRGASVVVAGTMAASTWLAVAGALPGPIQNVASHLLAKVGVSIPADHKQAETPPPAHPGSNHPSATGPDATGPAKFGLCNAFSHGQGAIEGGKAHSVAFQNLQNGAAAAGQSVPAFCAGATPGGHAGADGRGHAAGAGHGTGNKGSSDHKASRHEHASDHRSDQHGSDETGDGPGSAHPGSGHGSAGSTNSDGS